MAALRRWLGASALALASLVVALTGAAQQQFPAEATIRGENIWLRAEPAEETAILAYLQRGEWQPPRLGEAEAVDRFQRRFTFDGCLDCSSATPYVGLVSSQRKE